MPSSHYLSGDGVQNLSVLEDDETGHVRDNLSFSELFAHINLNIWQPHLRHEICWAHETPVTSPVGWGLIDDNSRLLPHEVHVQLEGHCQRDVVYFWNLWAKQNCSRNIQMIIEFVHLKNVSLHMNMKRAICWWN